MLKRLYVDFETYFDTESGYDLKNVSMTEYIRAEQFKTLGCGYLYEGEYGWVRGKDMEGFKELDWSNIEMVAHNIKFDGAIFAWKYGIRPARYFDTQSLAKAILGQNIASYSLKSVSEYLGLPPKGELKTDGLLSLTPEQEKQMVEYNQRDLECCAGIDEKLRQHFPDNQLSAMDWTIRAFINPKLRLNVALLEKMVAAEQKRKEGIFAKIGIPKEVFSSNKKFAELLESRKIEVPTKESPRDPEKRIPAFSLSDPGFQAIKDVAPELYEARVAAKSTITETRGGNLAYVGKTGAFPFDVQFSGAVQTHRYSGGSGAGGNPQNFPRDGDMRRSVCAPPEHKLVVGDFAAIELRILAWLSKEPRLISAILDGKDIYSEFASEIYYRKITKADKVERQVGKCAELGLGYGMGWEKFQKTVKNQAKIDISEDEARRVVKLYRTGHPRVTALWDDASKLIPQLIDGNVNCVWFAPFLKLEKNAIVLPSGLRLQYPNLRLQQETDEWVYDVYKRKYDSETARIYGGKLIENICQALAGEICKIAIERAEGMGLCVMGQVHDELLVVTEKSLAELQCQMLQEVMESPIPWWPEIRMGAEVKAGDNWKESK